ncbi:MAG: baseplate J/gp47 family protein [Gemmatimonadetes bacterium]|nr:baseplate J/gp47 family protein [Gemmatimonadota bacterium]
MSFRRRTFPEVLDNLLTSATGGVAAESHPFPPPGASAAPYRHALEQPPVAEVSSVFGSRNGEPHTFRKGTDYLLLGDRQTLEWQKGAELPDPETLVHVNYFPAAAQPVVTDVYTGSVVRTLAETVALEMSRVYAQLESVYRSGFVDTATGTALDNVVALLGIERVESGHAAGLVEFTRSPGTAGAITIPAGTRISTVDGKVEYETTDSVTLADGQRTIRVMARDLETNDPLPADSLVVLPVTIAGIVGVTNPAPTAIATQDETDEELRTRAKTFLHGSERATVGALTAAIARQGVRAEVVEDPETPGLVAINLHAEPEILTPDLRQRILQAIEDTRPVGVRIDPPARLTPAKVDLSVRLATRDGMSEAELRGTQDAVRGIVTDYFARLGVREDGSVNRIVGDVMAVPGVVDVRLVAATVTAGGATQDVLDRDAGLLHLSGAPTVLGDLQLADPALPTVLTATVFFDAADPPPDAPAIRTALQDALTTLNALNAAEPPAGGTTGQRTLSYARLAYVVPLPGRPGGTLQDYDAAASAGTPPAPSTGSYRLELVLTLESGLSRILSPTSDGYTLTPFERISLGSAEVREDGAHA